MASVSWELLTPMALAESESKSLIIGSGFKLLTADFAVDVAGYAKVVTAPLENLEATPLNAPPPVYCL